MSSTVLFLTASSLFSTYRVGLYDGADPLKKAANLVPEQTGNAFFPRVGHLFHKDRAMAVAATRKSITCSFLNSLSIVVFTFFFAGYVVRILLGEAFHDSANVLRVAVCGFIFGNVCYPAG